MARRHRGIVRSAAGGTGGDARDASLDSARCASASPSPSPRTTPRRAASPTFAETLAFAQHAEAVGLDSIWVFDHLLFRYGRRARRGHPRGMDDEGGACARRPAHRTRVARDVRLLPQPGIDGQDGRHARRPFRRSGDPRPRVGLARARVRRVRLPVRSSGRAVRRGPRDRESPAAGRALHVRGALAADARCRPHPATRPNRADPRGGQGTPHAPAHGDAGRTPGTRPGSAAPTSGCARGSRSSTRHATRSGATAATLRRTVGIRLADPVDGTADATTLTHRRRRAGIDLRRARGTRPRRHDRVVPVQVGRRAGPHRRGTSPPPRGAMTSRSATMPR